MDLDTKVTQLDTNLDEINHLINKLSDDEFLCKWPSISRIFDCKELKNMFIYYMTSRRQSSRGLSESQKEKILHLVNRKELGSLPPHVLLRISNYLEFRSLSMWAMSSQYFHGVCSDPQALFAVTLNKDTRPLLNCPQFMKYKRLNTLIIDFEEMDTFPFPPQSNLHRLDIRQWKFNNDPNKFLTNNVRSPALLRDFREVMYSGFTNFLSRCVNLQKLVLRPPCKEQEILDSEGTDVSFKLSSLDHVDFTPLKSCQTLLKFIQNNNHATYSMNICYANVKYDEYRQVVENRTIKFDKIQFLDFEFDEKDVDPEAEEEDPSTKFLKNAEKLSKICSTSMMQTTCR